ncbi:ferredoxin [Catellatospora tritici]|uniref:ferredoxin n=1 Tax=Catellatospora tritici TaxID=2851566 RepID=UPI001C2CF026|nr:hypothetical protein [Catellatospora tritici]MBV1855216.1 hypothetical protein [Catellatospora tritici]
MRVVVDLTKYEGYVQCALPAPEAFRMVGSEALMFDPSPPDELRERVLPAAAAWPVQAPQVDVADLPTPPPAATIVATEGDRFRQDGIVIVGGSLAGSKAAGRPRQPDWPKSALAPAEKRRA